MYRESGLNSDKKLIEFQKNRLYLDPSDCKIFELQYKESFRLSDIVSLYNHLRDELVRLDVILKNNLCRFCKNKLNKENIAKYDSEEMKASLALDNVCVNCIEHAKHVCLKKLKCGHWCNGRSKPLFFYVLCFGIHLHNYKNKNKNKNKNQC